jgi:hypothetical protein
MISDKLRRQIACEAARLIYVHQESEYHRAKLKAARTILGGWVRPGDLPSNGDIRVELQTLARMFESDSTGQAVERGNPSPPEPIRLSEFSQPASRNGDVDRELRLDRFSVYQALLAPLEHVKQNPKRHPEGDALYHSLQVFDLARDELPYDEEFLLAALLHDVGKAIDPRDHINAGLEALNGCISQRTAWLIEHQAQAAAMRDGTLGARSRRRLLAHECFDELKLLAKCDRQGRRRGVAVPDVDEALQYLRDLAHMCG